MYCRLCFVSVLFLTVAAFQNVLGESEFEKLKREKDHENVAQYFSYDSQGKRITEICPEKMIFNETLMKCVEFKIVKRSKRQSVGIPCNENIECITLDGGGAYCSPLKRCDCLTTSVNINGFCWAKINPGQTGCRYNEQCSAVWPGSTCTSSNACQCPNGLAPSRTVDGPVCISAGACPTNGFYSKLKNTDGTDVTCGTVFVSVCSTVLDYDCICTPPSTDPQSCADVVSFCCPSRALACIMPKEEGRSTGAQPLNKFYYNSATNECETLSFNGAGGNANNFDTKQQCESYCKTACRRGRTLYGSDYDINDAQQIRAVITCTNTVTNSCGNTNYICNAGDTTQTNVNSYCCPTAKFICAIANGGQVALDGITPVPDSPNVGVAVPNLNPRTRYYYDDSSLTCKTFQYLGAGGNYNNFATESECLSFCSSSLCEAGDVLRDVNQVPIDCSVTSTCPGRYDCVSNRCCPSKEFVCNQPQAIGTCTSYSRKWWFNPDSRTCTEFTYNGCQGNFNRFDTYNACQTYCGSSPAAPKCPQGSAAKDSSNVDYIVCSASSSTTTTVSACPSGYYCNFDGFRYGCCPSKTQTCETEGSTVPSSTPCITPVSRWYYNATSKQCAQFTYNGCDGTSNNFATQLDCQDYCGVGGCKDAGGEPLKESTGQYKVCTTAGNECLSGYSCSQVVTLTSNLNMFCCPTKESVCRLPKNEGTSCGLSSLTRFYFNPITRLCESLTYRGCGGNRNNFATATQCQSYCSSAACAPGQIAYSDPVSGTLSTCQVSTTSTSSSGCLTGYQCVMSNLLNQGVCCGSNAPSGTCPLGQSAFIDSFTLTPMQCMQNTDGQCPLTPNRYTCQPSFSTGSSFCCASVVVQCSRGGNVGQDALGNPQQCTPNIQENCPSGYECQPTTFLTQTFTSATGYCCGTPNPCGQGFNTLFVNNQPVTCDPNQAISTCTDSRYSCTRTGSGQGYCCVSSSAGVNPCASVGKSPYLIQNAPTVCIPGMGNTGAGCPVGYTCDLYSTVMTYYCCSSSGPPPPIGQSTCPSGSPSAIACTITANCGGGFVCRPGTASPVCCTAPATACIQPQMVGQICSSAVPGQRYSYNPTTRSCTAFTYQGCGANGNHFFSAQACEEFCMPALCARGRPQYVTGGSVQTCTTIAQCNPGYQCSAPQFGGGGSICCQTSASVCALSLDVGRSCTAQVPRSMQMWYFNSVSRTCQQFNFNGCGGNSNNFETQSECLTFCGGATPQNPCPSPRIAQINPTTNQPVLCINVACASGYTCTYSSTSANYYCCSRTTTTGNNGCPSGSPFLFPGTNSPLACTVGGPRCPLNYACVKSTSYFGNQCCSSAVATIPTASMPAIRCTSHDYCKSRLKSTKATCNLTTFLCSCDATERFANDACGPATNVALGQPQTTPVIRCTSHEYCKSRLNSPKALCNLTSLMCSCDPTETFVNNACGPTIFG